MGVADIAIVAAIAAAFIACVRYQMSGKSDGCADCAAGPSCAVHHAGSGDCPAAMRMVDQMEGQVTAATRPPAEK